MIRVFLLDDNEPVRRVLREVLEADDGIVVVGEASSAVEARALVLATRPDVVVLDVQLPDGSGLEVCGEIRATNPEIRCVMLSAFADDQALEAAAAAGASGYLLKQVRRVDYVAAIHAVAAGKSLLDREGGVSTRSDEVDGLTTDGAGPARPDSRPDR